MDQSRSARWRLTGGIAVATLLAAGGATVPPAEAQAPEFETTRIAEGVYQFRYASHNGFFVVTDGGVVAMDPISTEAAAVFAREIRRVAPGAELAAIIYSHHHADHATGAATLAEAFGGDVPVVAHENAAAPIREMADPALPVPDITFTDRMTLWFGGRAVELHHLGRNHSDNTVVALLPAERIAFAVDFVSNDRVGYRDLPDYYFPDFFESLERLRDLPVDRIVFGHGPPGDRAAIERQIAYYGDLRRAVEAAVENGLTEDQAAERVRLERYSGWGQYGEWFPMNVRAIHRWLSGRSGQ